MTRRHFGFVALVMTGLSLGCSSGVPMGGGSASSSTMGSSGGEPQSTGSCRGTFAGAIQGTFECKVTVFEGNGQAQVVLGIERAVDAGNMLVSGASDAFATDIKIAGAFRTGTFAVADTIPPSRVAGVRVSTIAVSQADFAARDMFAGGTFDVGSEGFVQRGRFRLAIHDPGTGKPSAAFTTYLEAHGTLDAELAYSGTLPAPTSEPPDFGTATVHVEF